MFPPSHLGCGECNFAITTKILLNHFTSLLWLLSSFCAFLWMRRHIKIDGYTDFPPCHLVAIRILPHQNLNGCWGAQPILNLLILDMCVCVRKYSFNKVEEKKSSTSGNLESRSPKNFRLNWNLQLGSTHSLLELEIQVPDLQIHNPDFPSNLRPTYPLSTKYPYLGPTGISNLACPKWNPLFPLYFPTFEDDHSVHIVVLAP